MATNLPQVALLLQLYFWKKIQIVFCWFSPEALTSFHMCSDCVSKYGSGF